MGFGEYHHWNYGEVLKEKPNYVAYVAMESERMGAPRKLFQEWLQGEKGQWAYRRNLAEGENPNALVEPNTMLEKRKIKRERGEECWRGTPMYRLMRGDLEALEDQERENERIWQKEKESARELGKVKGEVEQFRERLGDRNGWACLPSGKFLDSW